MSSYKSQKRVRRKIETTLKKKIVAVCPNKEKYVELNLSLMRLVAYSSDKITNFPRDQKWPSGLGCAIMVQLEKCMELSRRTMEYNPREDREALLREMLWRLKVAADFVRASAVNHYITMDGWGSWARKIVEVEDIVVGYAMWLQGHHEVSKG